ncbi:SDR family NAD(P)-dependent oxidoreductase [Scandinavium goeteborgense]|uniref:SDR family NAD(P)-dependent oxidoreductase n=1 Tax=Scandinavium goeteborgense TaxID=1851514 RepID=UPI0021664A0A|nr:SDR family NAD(P)-dependent oxidoreductase [Scandinavium goeteborgense]MCS2151054.1 SDR family NAD(P)-dependent oxidoreductase [Scandinavium goeteborgense]
MSKVCLVTGGSNGIGEAVCEKFIHSGYRVYNFDIKPGAYGQFIECDVSLPESIKPAMNKISMSESSIDHLVISAGIHFSGTVESTTTDDFERVIGINVKGAYLSIKESLPHMKQNGGSIVLVSSDQAFVGKKNSFAYNLSKSAVKWFTEFGHLNRGDMLTSEQYRCSNEKKKFQS